ncbi:tRNA threonylcarbamoyladenosine biosynthesis protein TsaE [Billgrantia gudaonensis]|uniref:tRNA threonylcarbamoyladenosine biosynthesis protein TsaE n=2 Tax=Billgrantia gudaonensis TaxID=376427 RepID=A0A1G9ANI5_9GAMM|nr:tRNA threonylcarbamoyladenosine biosynthesis protein TsaE [Halomonas gudaonensis]
MMRVRLDDEERQVAFGECLGRALAGRGRVHLAGELGAGKTTLARGVLRAYGHTGAVKSPTYTLVEPYELHGQRLFHFDLYRLGDPEELEFIGGRDLFGEEALILVEWPSRGAGWLPEPDLEITLQVAVPGREARLVAHTALGREALARLAEVPSLDVIDLAEERDAT